MHRYLFNTEKLKYVKGDKPSVPCILCAIKDNDPDVKNLEIVRSKLTIVTVNLYPFNPAHLMVFPARHVTSLEDLSDDEALDMHQMLCRCCTVIKKEFEPSGLNIGYNLGEGSGASIAHVHQHIVPRYKNEIGFLDVLAGTRIVVSEPHEVMERLKEGFKSFYDL